MALYLKINQDEAYDFFQKYNALSPLRKEIWKLTVWCVKNHLYCVPSQIYLAEKIGCCRQAVSEAFRIFKEYGWLSLTSRGWKRSKVLSIPLHLQQLDLKEQNYFRRVETTHRATHNYSNFNKSTSRKTGTVEIRSYLRKLNISMDAKLKLSLVPENIYQDALESAKKDASKGKQFPDEQNYLVGVALNMAKKRGFKIDWASYYRTIAA